MQKLITSYGSKKIADYLRQDKPSKVILVFHHGLGDLILFMEVYNKLITLFPDIKIDLALQEGTGQEVLAPAAILAKNVNIPLDGYDYTFHVHFPMCEGQHGLWTKAEWCCLQEMGIEPVSNYPQLPVDILSILIGVNFQATALPGACNPSEEVAEKIWNEVIEAGYIPVETSFEHCYFNPVNVRFDCVDRDVRSIPAGIDKLIRLMSHCHANITVATGTLPLSIALMPSRTLYLEKDFSIKSYTRQAIASVNVNDYKDGVVKGWLEKI